MKFKFIKIALILLISWNVFSNCQHARVRFPVGNQQPDEPKECTPPVKNKKACDKAKEKQEKELADKQAALQEDTKDIPMVFYFWGIRPKQINIKTSDHCPGRIKEIYQFTSWKQGIYDNVTLGIYSPKTLRIVCEK